MRNRERKLKGRAIALNRKLSFTVKVFGFGSLYLGLMQLL